MVAMRLLSMVAMPGRKQSPRHHTRSLEVLDTWNGREIHCSTQREGVNESLWVSLHVTHGRRRGRHHLFGFRPLNGGREARFIIAKSGTNAERDATEKIPIGARRTAPLGSLCVNNKKPLAVASDACRHPPLPPPPSPLLDATTTATATLAATLASPVKLSSLPDFSTVHHT